MLESTSNPIRLGILAEEGSRLAYGPALASLTTIRPVALWTGEEDVAPLRSWTRQLRSCTICNAPEDLLLDASIDAVLIACRSDMRSSYALQALRAGKHALVEPPITADPLDLERLASEAARANLLLVPAHALRHDPAVTEAHNRTVLGEVGAVRELRCEWSCRQGWIQRRWQRQPWYSAIAHHAMQTLDLARLWLGEATAVSADIDDLNVDPSDVGLANIIVQHENGASVHHIYKTSGTPRREHYILAGSRGALELSGPASGALDRAATLRLTLHRSDGEAVAIDVSHDEVPRLRGHVSVPYRRMLEDFVRALRDANAPLVTVKDGIEATRLFQAATTSSREGVKVQLTQSLDPDT